MSTKNFKKKDILYGNASQHLKKEIETKSFGKVKDENFKNSHYAYWKHNDGAIKHKYDTFNESFPYFLYKIYMVQQDWKCRFCDKKIQQDDSIVLSHDLGHDYSKPRLSDNLNKDDVDEELNNYILDLQSRYGMIKEITEACDDIKKKLDKKTLKKDVEEFIQKVSKLLNMSNGKITFEFDLNKIQEFFKFFSIIHFSCNKTLSNNSCPNCSNKCDNYYCHKKISIIKCLEDYDSKLSESEETLEKNNPQN